MRRDPLAFVPPVVGTAAGIVVLTLLVRRLRRVARRRRTGADAAGRGVDRRSFFRFAGVAAASALIVGVGARVVGATGSSIAAIREALKLPAPRTTIAVPAGAELDIPGLSPLFTPNDEFYRVDTALTVPEIDPASWRLTIDGMVDRRVELTFDDLVGMGLDEYSVTLTCVSNEVGGELLGTREVARHPGARRAAAGRAAGRAPTWCSRGASTASPRARRSSRSPTTGSTRSSPWA